MSKKSNAHQLQIRAAIVDHYRAFGSCTFPGCYLEYVQKNLPDDIRTIGRMVRNQLIHPTVLKNGNAGTNSDKKYGDMTKIPWYRQNQDDLFPTASAMMSELFRKDSRGLVIDRAEEYRLILSCRFTAVLMASILKAKNIPCRVRAGFAPYFTETLKDDMTHDHWINQYWHEEKKRWVTIDVDGSLEPLSFDPYDLPDGTFDFSADAWCNIRSGKVDGKHFWNGGGNGGLQVVAWQLFYDLHSLMNSEPIYLHTPVMTFFVNFPKLTEKQLGDIDQLAKLMQHPDENFDELKKLWETKKEFRLLGGLLL